MKIPQVELAKIDKVLGSMRWVPFRRYCHKHVGFDKPSTADVPHVLS